LVLHKITNHFAPLKLARLPPQVEYDGAAGYSSKKVDFFSFG
jgi:hypothetical protein